MIIVPITTDPIRIPLAADPRLAGANSVEAVRAYLESGDPSELTVPDGVLHITIRPPTPYDRADAEARAGVAPVAGLAASDVPEADQTDEHRAALSAWGGWWRRVQLGLVDRCIAIDGQPRGMATTTVVECIHHDDPSETHGLRLRVLAELIARVTLTSRLHQLPKAR